MLRVRNIYLHLTEMHGECRYSIHGAYGVWIPSHFYKMFEGNRPPWYPPWKKTPLKIDGWKRILFLVGGRLFFRGKLAVFKEWSFENSLHCLNLEKHLKCKETINPSSAKCLIGRISDMKRLREIFRQQNMPSVLQVYGFDFWPRKILLMAVSNLVKKSGMKYLLTGTGFLPSTTVSTRKTVRRLGHCLRHLSQMPQVS